MSSAVIDVVVAVALTFALTALVASAIVEWIGNLTRKRAKYLLRGLRNMLDARGEPKPGGNPGPLAGLEAEKALYERALEPTRGDVADLTPGHRGVAGGLTALVFDHPLLRGMMQPKQTASGERQRVPPYVPAQMFSRALLDTLVPPTDEGPYTLNRVREAIAGLDPSLPAREALLGLVDQARGNLEGFRTDLEHWYDAQMDRVSGWYKRWAKRWIIVVAAGLCLAFNIDAYAIASTLYRDPALRAAVVGQVQQGEQCAAQPGQPQDQTACVRDLVKAIDGTGRALWWPEGCPASPSACVLRPGDDPAQPPGVSAWLLKLLGLAVTTAAAAMGAPFWFDALNKLVNLRSTGRRPPPAA